jgi:hypothetical protein
MIQAGPIALFVAALQRQVAGSGRGRERIAREVEDHLRTTAAALEQEGWCRQEAERAAVARFGTPGDLARDLELEEAERSVSPGHLAARVLLAAGTNSIALAIVVRSLPDEVNWTVVLKFGLLLALFAYSAVILMRPVSVMSGAGGVALAALGLILVATYVYSAAAWPEFGACFTTIGTVLIVQGSIGAFIRPANPLTT